MSLGTALESQPSAVSFIPGQWHRTANGSLTPYDVLPTSSSKTIWWQCPVSPAHEWPTKPCERYPNKSRQKLIGCPFCEGKKACVENCVSTLRPDMAERWVPDKKRR